MPSSGSALCRQSGAAHRCNPSGGCLSSHFSSLAAAALAYLCQEAGEGTDLNAAVEFRDSISCRRRAAGSQGDGGLLLLTPRVRLVGRGCRTGWKELPAPATKTGSWCTQGRDSASPSGSPVSHGPPYVITEGWCGHRPPHPGNPSDLPTATRPLSGRVSKSQTADSHPVPSRRTSSSPGPTLRLSPPACLSQLLRDLDPPQLALQQPRPSPDPRHHPLYSIPAVSVCSPHPCTLPPALSTCHLLISLLLRSSLLTSPNLGLKPPALQPRLLEQTPTRGPRAHSPAIMGARLALPAFSRTPEPMLPYNSRFGISPP